jgi:DNA-binding NarL/FixJ family response regulator
MSGPSVVIVDDHQLFRAGVRAELDGLVEVLGDAATVGEAVRCILELQPDVVLLDVQMPGGGGVQVIRDVARTRPAQRFLALSVSDAAEDVIAIIRAGARGYVTKTISGPELADAVRRVAGGDAVFSPRLAGFVLDAFAGPGSSPRPPSTPSSTSSRPGSARSSSTSRAAISTRRSARGSTSPRRPWRRTCPRCSGSSSSPTATSSAAGPSSAASSTDGSTRYGFTRTMSSSGLWLSPSGWKRALTA